MFYAIYMNTPQIARSPALQLLGWAAAVCWLLSWFLPVVEDYPGWAAFSTVLGAVFRGAFLTNAEDSIPQVFSALTNVAFAVLFALWVRDRVTRPALFLKVALACLLINFYWLVEALRDDHAGDLLAGYYLWLMAFALLLALGVLMAGSAVEHR